MNTFKRIAMVIGVGSIFLATVVGWTLALTATGTMMEAGLAGLTGIGLALVLAVLATTNLARHHTRRRSDRSGVRRLGEFVGDTRVRASARRGWISWSPLG
ncbi:MAG: hypothetical protein M3R49_06935 [Chloroflexota bacterium]|nr:hypothetical protein [Chloroflexota bacterium]